MLKRTHNCNDLRKEHVGQDVILTGWAQKRRDHGGVILLTCVTVPGLHR